MHMTKSQISKKVLSWALVFALVVSFTPNIGATHEEDDTINVENAVFSFDDDGLSNDLLFLAHNRDDGVENITINVWKKNALGNWEEYDDGETDEDGELDFYNVTAGEYMWDAYEGNSKIGNEGGFAIVDTTYLVGHAGILSDEDGDGDFDDFIGYVFGANGTSDEGYVEIYDENGDLIDEGYTDEELDDNFTAFLATNIQRGNYTHYIYEEYNGTLIHNGSFHSYGSYNTTSNDDSDEWFESWDYDTEDTNGDDVANEINVIFDPDTDCNCSLEVNVYMDVYNNDTGNYVEWEYGNYTITGTEDDEFSMEWTAREDGNFTFYFNLYDDDWNWEDQFEVYEYLECDANNTDCESNNGNGTEDSDEWFADRDYYVEPSDTINIEYDPNTDCYCEVRVWVYIDVYQDGNKIDTIADDYYIYYTDYDWFEQEWTAYENDTYDFKVVLFDGENGPDNYEDEFWIYNVYLGSGNDTEDDGVGVGHLGVIDNFDDNDDYINDYIGGVLEDGEYKTDAYFEIYDEDNNLVDSGNPNYYGMIFVSSNLTEGWYYQYVYYEEDDTQLQNGPFYSYGNSSDFTVINVDNAVVDDDEYAVYDDVGFIAHQGMIDRDSVADVEIEIFKYNETSDDWEYHASLVTNESGEAWLYNETCGEYEWTSSPPDNGPDDKGYYEVWAHCDDTVDPDEDHDEWFYNWDYDVNPSDTITIGYDPDTECDCEVDIEVTISIFDNATGDWIDWTYDEYTIYNGQGDWFEQNWTAYEDGSYDFWVELHDQENEHGEDDFWIYNVSLVSDEDYDEWIHAWIHYVPQDENGNNNWNEIVIGYDPETECDCDVNVSVHLEVYDENGNLAADSQSFHTINGEQEDWFLQEISMNIEPGEHDFFIDMYDEAGNHEEHKEFTLIMSDEWLDYDWAVEDSNVKIDLQGNTNYDGEINTYYEANVYRWNEDENDWEKIDELAESATISSGEENSASIHFEWEAEESGDYRFVVYMADGMGQEDSFDFEEEIILNSAPVIHGINTNHVFEGQMFNFEVDVTDDDGDKLEFSWDMGDGTLGGGPWGLHDDSIMYVYPDDGEYIITVKVSDGNGGRAEENFTIWVMNTDPILQLSYDDFGQEGQTLSFTAQTTDVPDDDVLVTWTFPDGTQVEGNFAQYRFADDGEFMIGVTAEDEDGGRTSESLVVNIENVAPIFTEFQIPSTAQEGETLDFTFDATDPGDDTIVFNIDFGDGTAPTITQDGNVSHRFAEGDSFTLVICAKDEDGGETCRQQILPVSVLEQLEEEGLLPGFNLLLAISALGIVGMLRRRTH